MSCTRSATRADQRNAHARAASIQGRLLHRPFAPEAGLSSAFEGPRFRISPDSNRVADRAFLNDFMQINELFLSLLARASLPSAPPGN